MDKRYLTAIVLAIFIIGTSIFVYYLVQHNPLPLFVSILLSIMLAALPLLICYAQTFSIDRQIDKLKTLNDRDVSNTTFFKVALSTLNSLKDKSLNPGIWDRYFRLPLFSFAAVVLFCWLVTTTVDFNPAYFSHPSVLLGGMYLTLSQNHAAADGQMILTSEQIDYQRGTFVAGCFGFIGAYVYTVWRLLDRINNNDIYPISFYYYSSRIIAACVVAGVVRLVAPTIVSQYPIVIIAFVTGFVPDLFVTSLIRRASTAMSVLSTQDDPPATLMPSNFSLLMIQGLDRDKIDRLAELNVTNAEILSCQNPFILWLKLPYELLLIVDWISQAQLYRIAKDKKLAILRDAAISGIIEFDKIISEEQPRNLIAQKTEIPADVLQVLSTCIKEDPTFIRLKEVYIALARPMT